MKINQLILDQFAVSNSQLLVVSKYFSPTETDRIIETLKNNPAVIGFGENRPQSLIDKNIDRNICHFIGNIQSRQIPTIAQYCCVVHSLTSLKHAHILAEQSKVPACFVQINVSGEKQKGGVMVDEIEGFLKALPTGFCVQGISAIGAYTDNYKEKQKEFQRLLDLRAYLNTNKKYWDHLKVLHWQISAGTSIDYKIALDYQIGIVRVGRALFSG